MITIDGGASHPRGTPLTVHDAHPDGVAQIDLYLAGERVAQAADTLSWDVDADVGSSLDRLAVAVARNAQVMRPGWPKPDQQPRPGVQGSTHAMVTVTTEPPDGGAGGAGGGSAGGGGGRKTRAGEGARRRGCAPGGETC